MLRERPSVATMVPVASMFSFEEDFDPWPRITWMNAHWQLSLYVCTAYVAAAYVGHWLCRRWKRRRSVFVDRSLVAWNAMMAAFSVAGCYRLLPEMWSLTSKFGFQFAVCDPLVLHHPVATGFWLWAYVVSKLVELGDTAFVVLRERPLTFLHLFHHAATMVSAWYGYGHQLGLGRWLVAVNYLVHAVMYTYYTVHCAGLPLPRRAAMAITLLQLMQMVWGVVVSALTWTYVAKGANCTCDGLGVAFCTFMYVAYVLLFVRFFRHAYLRPKPLTMVDGNRTSRKAD